MSCSAACSISASSKTMKGALPPSSNDSLVTCSEHCCIKILPTPVEPVNDNLRTLGEVAKRLPTVFASLVGMILMTPSGIPTSLASCARAKLDKGVSWGGLTTIVQPAANAGAILRVIMAFGKFHGVMAAQTPTGSLVTMTRLLLSALGNISPSMRSASPANQSTKLAPYSTSPTASATGLPCSALINSPSACLFSIMASYHLRRRTARSRAVFLRQLFKAVSATLIARCVKSSSASATSANTSPVAGLVTEKRLSVGTQ